MKVLAFNGSPRRKGNTEILLEAVSKGILDAGGEIEIIRLAGRDISPCISCGSCEKTGVCAVKDEMQPFPIAYLLEGEFSSYFEGKPIPKKEQAPEQAGEENTAAQPEEKSENSQPKVDSRIEGTQDFISKGKPGKILLVSSTEMIKDNVLDNNGRSPNDMLVMNLVDYLNNREGIAVMRSKEQRFNPLDDVGGGMRTFVKSFNIVGLPVVVAVFGLIVLFRRHGRKRRIQAMFR